MSMLGKERAAYEAIQANSNAAGRDQADQLCTGCSTAFSDFVIDRWKWRGGAGRHGVAVRAGASVRSLLLGRSLAAHNGDQRSRQPVAKLLAALRGGGSLGKNPAREANTAGSLW